MILLLIDTREQNMFYPCEVFLRFKCWKLKLKQYSFEGQATTTICDMKSSVAKLRWKMSGIIPRFSMDCFKSWQEMHLLGRDMRKVWFSVMCIKTSQPPLYTHQINQPVMSQSTNLPDTSHPARKPVSKPVREPAIKLTSLRVPATLNPSKPDN